MKSVSLIELHMKSCRIETWILPGLPKLMGPVLFPFISLIRPLTYKRNDMVNDNVLTKYE
jgi:hypothetical protein